MPEPRLPRAASTCCGTVVAAGIQIIASSDRQAESRGHDADDGIGAGVELQRTTKDVGCTAVVLPPKCLTDDRDRLSIDTVIGRLEHTVAQRACTEQIDIGAIDDFSLDLTRRTGPDDHAGSAPPRTHAIE
jgi:hypothetical protein